MLGLAIQEEEYKHFEKTGPLPPIPMPWVVGQRCREYIYTGDTFGAEEAQRIGLVNRVFDSREALYAGVREIALQIPPNPGDMLEISRFAVALREPREEIVLVEVVGDAAADEVHELAAIREIVDDHDVVVAASVELTNQVAADEAGAAGDEDVDHRVPVWPSAYRVAEGSEEVREAAEAREDQREVDAPVGPHRKAGAEAREVELLEV